MTDTIPTPEQIEAMSGPELVEAYNALTGKAIKKFSKRSVGVARLLQAAEQAGEATEAATTSPLPPKNTTGGDTTPRRNHGKPPRVGSKRAQAVAMLSRKKGATRDELGRDFEWKPRDVRDALRIIEKRDGYQLTEDDTGRIKIVS